MRATSLLVPLLVFVCGGCKDTGSTEQPSPIVFRIDLQSQFSNDSVRVHVDGEIVLEERLTTNHILSLARSISVDVSAGHHDVRVQLVDPYMGDQKDTIVLVKDTLTLAVSLDERSRTLYFTVHPFLVPYR